VRVQTVVYEQADRLREVGAGLTLWANASKALGKLEAGGLLAIGSAIERFEMRNWRRYAGYTCWRALTRFEHIGCLGPQQRFEESFDFFL
jgi:2-polyprenyl-6-methoxyphenol hydroxylase-like FAD-dependent oxidoreductase